MDHVLKELDAVMHVASEASMNKSQDQLQKNVNLMMLNMLQTIQKN